MPGFKNKDIFRQMEMVFRKVLQKKQSTIGDIIVLLVFHACFDSGLHL
jgi:hypothetical protein